jgi:hypothetical protein
MAEKIQKAGAGARHFVREGKERGDYTGGERKEQLC